MGDPAGIGPEVTLKSVADQSVHNEANVVVLGDYNHLVTLADDLGIDVSLRRIDDIDEAKYGAAMEVINFDNVSNFEYGELRKENGRVSLAYVDASIDLAVNGAVDGLCNAPIHKKAINLAGSEFAGHTDMMAARTDTDQYTALLTDGDINVTHNSIHIPIMEAVEQVTTENVLGTIEVTAEKLPEAGIDDPSLGVVGINPHAGDGGVIGSRDDEEIVPAIEQAQDQGIDVEGPLPPDSAFNRALDDHYDCMVAMYHDQGHIPVYVHGLLPSGGVAGVNMTIGLPIVRTSTMHGTAFDIAGTGIADPDSIVDAVRAAVRAARGR